VVAARGPARRTLPHELPAGVTLPSGFGAAHVCAPGIVAVAGPPITPRPTLDAGDEAAIWKPSAGAGWSADIERLVAAIGTEHPLRAWPLLVVVDDPAFAARRLDNLLWVTFTRSNPAPDVHGVVAVTRHKHWGCEGPLVIDARLKPHHAPPVEDDPVVSARVDALCARGGPLAGIVG